VRTVISYTCGCGVFRLLPELSKKFIKKMITTYAHHIDLFTHPEERFTCYFAMSTTKLRKKEKKNDLSCILKKDSLAIL
jgi:hypothetical protein